MPLRKDLEELVNVGKKEQKVTILGKEVILRLLDAGDNIECMKACVGLDVFAREKELKVQTLSRSVISINGLLVQTEELLEFFRRLQEPVLNIFMDSYMTLRELQLYEVDILQNPEKVVKKAEKKDGKQKP
jgi:hypothetical protein